MLNEATNGRKQRGLEIAATQIIGRNNAGDFMVPSQSGPGKYRVVREAEGLAARARISYLPGGVHIAD